MSGNSKKLRLYELGLLLFGFIILIFGYINILFNYNQPFTTRLLVQPILYILIIVALHLLIRKIIPFADPLILPIVNLLNGTGLLMIYRLDYVQKSINVNSKNNNDNFYFSEHQIMWLFFAATIFVLTIIYLKDYKILAVYNYSIGVLGLFLLILPAILPAKFSEINGSKIWISTPFFNIQPGEFAKVILVCFTAAYLVSKQDILAIAGTKLFGYNLPRFKELAPILITVSIAILVLVFERDLGTSLLIFLTILIMFYTATGKKGWIAIAFGIFIVAAYISFQLFDHLQTRIIAWRDPFANFQNEGYQLSQSLFSFGTGGLFGTGLGAGQPNLIPEVESDFILAAIAEELGLFGLFGIIMLFLILFFRGFKLAIKIKDPFGKLFAFGLTISLTLQLFVVFGGITKFFPLTGITTPFVSYGGSSLLANYLLLAILLRLSNTANTPSSISEKLIAMDDAPTQLVKLK